MITAAFYLITLTLVFFGITGIIQTLICVPLYFVSKSTQINSIIGGIGAWLLVDFFWTLAEGNHMPLSIMIISFIILGIWPLIVNSETKLTSEAKDAMAGEMWGITLTGIYVYAISENTLRYL